MKPSCGQTCGTKRPNFLAKGSAVSILVSDMAKYYFEVHFPLKNDLLLRNEEGVWKLCRTFAPQNIWLNVRRRGNPRSISVEHSAKLPLLSQDSLCCLLKQILNPQSAKACAVAVQN